MTPNEYQKLALRTEKTPLFVNRFVDGVPVPDLQLSQLLHGAIGMCTETGELQDMIKRHAIYGKGLDFTNVLEECGDKLWYIALALFAAGYTMEEAMVRNVAKLEARYGGSFSEEKALNRDLEAERRALEDKESPLSTAMSGAGRFDDDPPRPKYDHGYNGDDD